MYRGKEYVIIISNYRDKNVNFSAIVKLTYTLLINLPSISLV